MRKNLFLILIWAALAVLPLWDSVARLGAQEDPWDRGSVGAALLLRQLDGVKRVLMIGAHPDDEDTALLTALARGMGAETAYLSLTRGEGGQNLLGPELDEGLGVIRTGELLAARALDGGTQFFTRAFDFGFSKSAEETFLHWPREELLRDVTWVVRTFRPHVLVSVFDGTDGEGHGHHQVAGMIARDAFRAAGDSARFADQLTAGAAPWVPLKLYRIVRRDPPAEATAVETGTFDPLLGRSHLQVAMEGRSQHRSQDMGTVQPLGPRRSSLVLVESRVEHTGPDELFAGVDTTLLGLIRDLPEPSKQEVGSALRAYRGALEMARLNLEPERPWETVLPMGRALEALETARKLLGGTGDPWFPDGAGAPSASSELGRVVTARLALLREALLRAAGVMADIRVEADLLAPGDRVEVTVEVWNGGLLGLAGVHAELDLPAGWSVDRVDGDHGAGSRDLAPGTLARWVLHVRVHPQAELSRLYYLEEPRDGDLYRWPMGARASLGGSPGIPEVLRARLGMDLEGVGSVRVLRTGRYRGVNKATGEYSAPVLVVPALSVHLEPSTMVWPLGMTEPRQVETGSPRVEAEVQEVRTESREVRVRVRAHAQKGQRGTVGLEAPPGWSVAPREHAVDLASAGAEASFAFTVTPPPGVAEGTHSLRAAVRTRDGAEYREGLQLVDYPHIPRVALFSPATTAVSVFPVALEQGVRVGYVMGSGDSGAEALRQMGAAVELLGPEAVRAGAYEGLHTVVLGIRAYETRPDLVAANTRLLEYARSGGTVIVQYNKYEYPDGGFAPFPVTMARPHDRVTEEATPVRILHPEHPIFRYPNPIGPQDFDGWVQERGLYFLRDWDQRFTPLLEMADSGEDPLRGGLVVARVGEGAYVYTGLALFRQFSRGVPGAHRLFANLVSLQGRQLDAR